MKRSIFLSKISGNAQLCFIVNQYCDPPVSIATLIFEGETEKDVKEELDRALTALHFRTLYSYIISSSASTFQSIFRTVLIKEIVDYPGAEYVKISLEVKCESGYFLPRDSETGKFVDIDKQVKCLGVLKVLPESSNHH